MDESATDAARVWADLDEPWQEAFWQGLGGTAIQFVRIGAVRFAGADHLWDGYHEFSKLSEIEAWRSQPERSGPRADELGTFATLMSRFGPTLVPEYEQVLRELGEGPMVDLVRDMERDGEVARLASMEVEEAFGYLWPRLQDLSDLLHGPGMSDPRLRVED